MCPACERIRDDMPAGILTLSGTFLEKHRDEILKLIQNKVEQEKAWLTGKTMARVMR